MGKLFGTDGVRGIANEKLSCMLAFQLGQAAAKVLTNEVHQAKILIGKDTRISGDMLESALIAGICSAGAEACTLGVIPTSAVAHLTQDLICKFRNFHCITVTFPQKSKRIECPGQDQFF